MNKPLVKWTINPCRSAIIVVDMQRVFCDESGALYVPQTKTIISNIRKLIDAARAEMLPVIYLRHVVRGDGTDTGRMRDLYPDVDTILARGHKSIEIIEEIAPKREDVIIDKLFYSGFHNTDLDTVLRSRDIDTLIVCGTVTNVCCETTIRDGAHREYKMIALSDGNAAMDYPDLGFGSLTAEQVQRVSMTTIAYEFGEVATTDNVIRRLRSTKHVE
ncbi:cysteine hydrolase family protein [Kushneria aurantia]|uniref:Cysteine hydrolase family protein n=1 Tax=Kushneria aurantia TaxID=504092 RepID=A0ABV6G022_9GAMM|nr:isochorismatase family cysteine hydrolase [Kushneria aurantia]